MQLSIVAALAKNRVIGRQNSLPWHLPADLAHFKQLTLGKPVLMGRKTYESIGRPLPQRRNIVISHNPQLQLPGCECVTNVADALALVADAEEAMVIGGANIYQQLLPQVSRLYLTLLDLDVEGDAYFPEYDMAEWREVTRENFAVTAETPFKYAFVTLEREGR